MYRLWASERELSGALRNGSARKQSDEVISREETASKGEAEIMMERGSRQIEELSVEITPSIDEGESEA
jgi:hypothetical protein